MMNLHTSIVILRHQFFLITDSKIYFLDIEMIQILSILSFIQPTSLLSVKTVEHRIATKYVLFISMYVPYLYGGSSEKMKTEL